MKRVFLIIFLLPLLFSKAANSPLDLDKMKKDTLTVYYHELQISAKYFHPFFMGGISTNKKLKLRKGQSLKRFVQDFYDQCYFTSSFFAGGFEIYYSLSEEERKKENFYISSYGDDYLYTVYEIGSEKEFELKDSVVITMVTAKIEGVFLETDIENVPTCSNENPIEDIPNMKEKCYILYKAFNITAPE